MAKDIREFDGWLDEYDWPRVACPTCVYGSLSFNPAEMTRSTDTHSTELVDLHLKNLGPPEELTGTFHGHLDCDNTGCGERVTLAGDWQLVFNEGFDPSRGQLGNIYRVRYVNPPLRLIRLPKDTPPKVADGVTSAAKVIWVSPSSAANRLRYAAEALLAHEGVPPTSPSGGLVPLGRRISEYAKTEPELAKALKAVSYIGNEGSHDELLTITQVLEGATILAHVIAALYDKSEAAMAARIKAINDAMGVLNLP
ncbi:DUF4145 domain-containing protein [Nocardioides sp. ChNu-153]|uniref:DUF4145 domain-containing protein n=1 Tax=unclassified Nocardioides TaxID=2615069 RepID=UPI0024063BA8|nr:MULTISPECIES: DUF4145 domain-containing protein [unclassified Nocardioides]MDF9716304.1 DUF4145 domain-containing protein [Nocardioides sp. ChNu-99]MDN7122734.1 DUF4145 domain-containing protein [Nocardioides sp. ChNu-153]